MGTRGEATFVVNGSRTVVQFETYDELEAKNDELVDKHWPDIPECVQIAINQE